MGSGAGPDNVNVSDDVRAGVALERLFRQRGAKSDVEQRQPHLPAAVLGEMYAHAPASPSVRWSQKSASWAAKSNGMTGRTSKIWYSSTRWRSSKRR